MPVSQYKAPAILLKEVLHLVPPEKRAETKVLDVAAGTGWVGRDLYKEGFRCVSEDGFLSLLSTPCSLSWHISPAHCQVLLLLLLLQAYRRRGAVRRDDEEAGGVWRLYQQI